MRGDQECVSCPSRLDPATVEGWLAALCGTPQGGPLRVDLSGTSFVDPYGLAALVGLIRSACQERDVILVPPQDPAKLNYLAAARLFDLLPDGVTVDGELPDTGFRQTTRGRVMPMRRLAREDDVLGAADHIESIVGSVLRVPPTMARNVGRAMSELCSNVVEHADDPNGGFAAAQAYDRHYDRRAFVVIGVGDCGVGMRATLQRGTVEQIASDEQAISMALRPRTTGRHGPGGLGLPRVRDITAQHQGRLDTRSGSGLVTPRSPWTSPRGRGVVPLRGTLVHISLYAP